MMRTYNLGVFKWMMIVIGLWAVCMLLSTKAHAATPVNYYVSVDGNDGNTGLGPEPSKALRYIQTAANKTNPGDTVYIMNGTYWDNGSPILTITRSGTANAYITYKAYPGHTPILRVSQGAWNHIMVKGASYINIEGLEIYGWSENLSNTEAQSYENTNTLGNIGKFNTNGISIVKNSDVSPTVYATHINVRNNKVHHAPGQGIGAMDADYINISGNTVYNNCWFSAYAQSGISINHSRNTDSNTGYKIFISGNRVYGNQANYKWQGQNKYSDGNGIIIDDNKNLLIGGTPYTGKTIVENNISYSNGGSGINIFSSQYVYVNNNTTYANSQSPHLDYAEIMGNESSNVYVVNNIMYANGETVSKANDANGVPIPSVYFNSNIFYNGAILKTGTGNLTADPLFTNLSLRNFHLQSTSPAINSGDNTYSASLDFDGVSRPVGGIVDRGAYEYH
ncbi:choice-of-anchor Q domain-containing protein [Paenibacillus roseipurpureus]|uniref:Choice-of-anchor Q domain-containing protein n=1 Tax=Paenibacillus roseopurpureus TaxID=2918901 RepID=A0AA96RL26_9BACL|nr:choice-of-anchor Q domain-containing protein [Paenibacillus sp. MBLB1832]WNR47013.1 choice-of-anchor Q domain-containing protein [Paenibacillus sp. MBLB1832]